MKDDFIASVSHELRTPLFAVQGFLDLLAGGRVQDYATLVDRMQRFLIGKPSAVPGRRQNDASRG